MSYPERLGLDESGIIFFYDEGNNYIRMIDVDGYIHTLIKGSCR